MGCVRARLSVGSHWSTILLPLCMTTATLCSIVGHMSVLQLTRCFMISPKASSTIGCCLLLAIMCCRRSSAVILLSLWMLLLRLQILTPMTGLSVSLGLGIINHVLPAGRVCWLVLMNFLVSKLQSVSSSSPSSVLTPESSSILGHWKAVSSVQ